MEHSITTTQVGVGPGTPSEGGHWKSSLKWPWSVTAAVGETLICRLRYLKSLMGPDLSKTLDIDRLTARLAIEARGRADGSREEPASAEETLFGTQREIVAYFKKLRQRMQRKGPEMTTKLRELGEDIDIPANANKVREILSRCENEILRLNAEFRSQIMSLAERELQQQRQYDEFRERNGLTRPAEYSRSRVTYHAFIATLVFAVAVSMGNIPMSAAGGETLFQTGLTIGIALAAVMIPFGMAVTALRWINHADSLRKLGGWLAAGLLTAFVGALTLFTTHYLGRLGSEPSVTLRFLGEAILAAPLAITMNTAAWTGSAIVVLGAILATLAGYKSDDAYPGYGAAQRAFYLARTQRDLLGRRLRKRINAIIDRARAELTALPSRAKLTVKNYARLEDESRRFPAEMSGYEVALEDACNILLDRYRAANISARRTEPPVSFSEHISFRSVTEPAGGMVNSVDSRLEDLQKGVARLEEDITQALQNLQELNWSAIRDLEDAPCPEEDTTSGRQPDDPEH